ncbi:cytosine-specific methyltransferase [Paenibacillus alvei DSM 29]|uniref:DNA cytosine methyltransferase n=3 Tax=Paenibacillus alvei TaxID=44250 RepID=UPI000288A2B5|nr:DNA (cytosine-5-)-methyltransferase [Paenibacillus alvei]EJW14759.1 cytosine-specific methyltransferase [Paenibacillus alvei DSM 29]
MNKLSLFSGIGGIDLAAEWAGMTTVAFCEREPFPQRVLRKHWPNVQIYDDVCELTREVLERDGIITNDRTIDIVSAGFPCQPFSLAGKRDGTEDERYLWPEVVRILQEIKPTWFIGENVPGIISMANTDGKPQVEGRTILHDEEEDIYEALYTQQEELLFGRICKDLEDIGYEVQPFIIPAAAIGASHRRDRVFILGYTNSSRQQECNTTSKSDKKRHVARGDIERGEASANTNCKPRLETDQASSSIRSEWYTRDNVGRCRRASTSGAGRWTTESRLGGMSYEFSDWLDGCGANPLDSIAKWMEEYLQPAFMGHPQNDWEPPRVVKGINSKEGRLKALGNAVDPVQILPMMYGIKAIDDYMGREGRA